jgi:hypothetical protein
MTMADGVCLVSTLTSIFTNVLYFPTYPVPHVLCLHISSYKSSHHLQNDNEIENDNDNENENKTTSSSES